MLDTVAIDSRTRKCTLTTILLKDRYIGVSVCHAGSDLLMNEYVLDRQTK